MIRGPLQYLIGADADAIRGIDGVITELPFDATRMPKAGISILYGNLLDENFDERTKSGRYGPYATAGDTAEEWGEGQIDPKGKGWDRNIHDQLVKAKGMNAAAIEWDNADSYHLEEVLDALDRSQTAGVQVIAKNPLMVEGKHVRYLAHPAVVGAIVEAYCGTCDGMQALRVDAGKPHLPVWFVSNKAERDWALKRSNVIKAAGYLEMGVTWCPSSSDYSLCVDILKPRRA